MRINHDQAARIRDSIVANAVAVSECDGIERLRLLADADPSLRPLCNRIVELRGSVRAMERVAVMPRVTA